jgi:hypothetical protein
VKTLALGLFSLTTLAGKFSSLNRDMLLRNIEFGLKLAGKLLSIYRSLKEHLRDAVFVLGLPFELSYVLVDEGQQGFISFSPKTLGNVNFVKCAVTWTIASSM